MKASFRPLQRAEALANGLHIGQRLAGMIGVAQRVDHRHATTIRASPSTVACAKTRATMPSTQRSRLRATSFSGSRTPMGPSHEHRSAAHLLHGQLKGEPRAQRRLLEQQRDGLARQRLRIVARCALDVAGQIEQVDQLVAGEGRDRAENRSPPVSEFAATVLPLPEASIRHRQPAAQPPRHAARPRPRKPTPSVSVWSPAWANLQ